MMAVQPVALEGGIKLLSCVTLEAIGEAVHQDDLIPNQGCGKRSTSSTPLRVILTPYSGDLVSFRPAVATRPRGRRSWNVRPSD